jgi:hypothetical protein
MQQGWKRWLIRFALLRVARCRRLFFAVHSHLSQRFPARSARPHRKTESRNPSHKLGTGALPRIWGCRKARGGRISAAIFDRRATRRQPQRLATLRAGIGRASGRVAPRSQSQVWLCSLVAPCHKPARSQRTHSQFMRWVLKPHLLGLRFLSGFPMLEEDYRPRSLPTPWPRTVRTMARTAAFNESANKGHADAISSISAIFCESICECEEGFRGKIADFVGFESRPFRHLTVRLVSNSPRKAWKSNRRS